jgi:hypothetical protein
MFCSWGVGWLKIQLGKCCPGPKSAATAVPLPLPLLLVVLAVLLLLLPALLLLATLPPPLPESLLPTTASKGSAGSGASIAAVTSGTPAWGTPTADPAAVLLCAAAIPLLVSSMLSLPLLLLLPVPWLSSPSATPERLSATALLLAFMPPAVFSVALLLAACPKWPIIEADVLMLLLPSSPALSMTLGTEVVLLGNVDPAIELLAALAAPACPSSAGGLTNPAAFGGLPSG